MDVIVLIGRIVFCLIFFASAAAHLTQRNQMSNYARSMGLPNADILVPFTGVQMLVGALMVVLGIWADLGLLILIAFLVPTAVLMHPFWKMEDTQERAIQQAAFMKNISMSGAAFALFGLIGFAGSDLGLTITESLFSFS